MADFMSKIRTQMEFDVKRKILLEELYNGIISQEEFEEAEKDLTVEYGLVKVGGK